MEGELLRVVRRDVTANHHVPLDFLDLKVPNSTVRRLEDPCLDELSEGHSRFRKREHSPFLRIRRAELSVMCPVRMAQEVFAIATVWGLIVIRRWPLSKQNLGGFSKSVVARIRCCDPGRTESFARKSEESTP